MAEFRRLASQVSETEVARARNQVAGSVPNIMCWYILYISAVNISCFWVLLFIVEKVMGGPTSPLEKGESYLTSIDLTLSM
jgi:hypothetical protein